MEQNTSTDIIGNPAWDGGTKHRADLIANTRENATAIVLSSLSAGVILTLMSLAALSRGLCSL